MLRRKGTAKEEGLNSLKADGPGIPQPSGTEPEKSSICERVNARGANASRAHPAGQAREAVPVAATRSAQRQAGHSRSGQMPDSGASVHTLST